MIPNRKEKTMFKYCSETFRNYYIVIISALVMTISSCGANSEYSTSHLCNFSIDTRTRQDATLISALNYMASGVFCRISMGQKNGAQSLLFESNMNQSSYFAMNAEEKLRSYSLGVLNESGIIVGFGNLAAEPTLYAFDAVCPNCYEAKVTGCYAAIDILKKGDGIAVCKLCERGYNLNTGGNVVRGDGGRSLYRYVASVTSEGFLRVGNR